MNMDLADKANAFNKEHGITEIINKLHALNGEPPNVMRMNTRCALDTFGVAPMEMFGLAVVLDPRMGYNDLHIGREEFGDDEEEEGDGEDFQIFSLN